MELVVVLMTKGERTMLLHRSLGWMVLAPFLVAAPVLPGTNAPTDYVVTGLPGGTLTVPVFTQGDGKKRLSLDLEPLNLSDGTYNVTVQATNLWGGSAPVPFSFTRGAPAPASGVSVSKTP